MVMDGRKCLLLKAAVKTSLDFPKVSAITIVTPMLVRAIFGQGAMADGKDTFSVNGV